MAQPCHRRLSSWNGVDAITSNHPCRRLGRLALGYSYVLYSYGQHPPMQETGRLALGYSYGLYSHGLHSYGQHPPIAGDSADLRLDPKNFFDYLRERGTVPLASPSYWFLMDKCGNMPVHQFAFQQDANERLSL